MRTAEGDEVLAGVTGRLARDVHLIRIGDRASMLFDLERPAPARIVTHEPAAVARERAAAHDTDPVVACGLPMSDRDAVEIRGKVSEVLPDLRYRVTSEREDEVLVTLSARARGGGVRVGCGDPGIVHVSPYDLGRGRTVALFGAPEHPPAA